MATMTEKKITNKIALEKAIACMSMYGEQTPETAEVVAKLEKMLESTAKKNAKSGKPTKAQEANAILIDGIAEFMADQPDRLFTISEISKECPAVMGATPQKIRPLLTALIKEQKVERSEGKGGKPLFQFVGKVEED